MIWFEGVLHAEQRAEGGTCDESHRGSGRCREGGLMNQPVAGEGGADLKRSSDDVGAHEDEEQVGGGLRAIGWRDWP